MIQKREIALSIILSIITCGFYSIYWYIVMVDDVNKISKKPNPMSGVLTFLIGLVTCGIFTLYTFYRMGDDLDSYFVNKGNAPANKGLLYLVISIFGLSIVSMALIQNDLNNIGDDFTPANVVDVAYTETSSKHAKERTTDDSSSVNLDK